MKYDAFAKTTRSYMKGVIYMIDRKNLEKLITSTQIVLLERVRKLGEAAKLLDDIKLAAIDESNGDDSLNHFIATQIRYRTTLAQLDKEWDEIERDLWDKMLHIDIPD